MVSQSIQVRKIIRLLMTAYFDEYQVGDGVLIDPETWEISMIDSGFLVETLDDRYIKQLSPEAYRLLKELQ